MGFDSGVSRKHFLSGALLALGAPLATLAQQSSGRINLEDIKAAERIAGIKLTDEQRRAVLASFSPGYDAIQQLRTEGIGNEVSPAFVFSPVGKKPKAGFKNDVRPDSVKGLRRPEKDEDIAFLTVAELGSLIRSRQLSPIELTEIYLRRLKEFGPRLRCVITLTEDLARTQAKLAQEEIQKGKYRGPLHGIPYGIKDLFAVKDYVTTWGAEPFREQVIANNSAVFEQLTAAGAICVAKTSVGALAYGDLWFGGLTLNPWNPRQGSSGSSAGSASGVAAGLFAFGIGTETLGSIISPSQRCRVTGLRPTFGRVSRRGAMALSWTMDKVGPLARCAEDCALIFASIHGAEPGDAMSVDFPFAYHSRVELSKLKIGVIASPGFDEDDVAKEIGPAGSILQGLGAKLVPTKFSPPTAGVDEVLSIEAAAAFDQIVRDGRVDSMKGSLWPPIFRAAQLMSGVDYIQAMRARTHLMNRFETELGDLDLVIAPERGGDVLVTTNLTGHPQMFVPMGVNSDGRPIGVSLIGRLYDEGKILSVANMIQKATSSYRLRPDLTRLP